MIRSPRRMLSLAVLVACVGFVTVACGDDPDSSGTTASDSSTTASVTAAGTTVGTTTAVTTAATTSPAETADPITRSLQEDLRVLGFYKGPLNGTYDAATTAGVEAFQLSADLAQDGIAGPQTHVAIDFELGRESSQTVALLQEDLTALCHYSGPLNGVYTSATEAAVAEFQKATGLAVDGQFGPQTAVALIRERGSAPSSCASTPATSAATNTGPAEPAATVTVRGPAYSKTFEVVRCTPTGETGVDLRGTASGGFTIRLVVTDGSGTLAIGGGTEEDGLRLMGTVDSFSVGDAGDIRGSGEFTPSPSGPPAFSIAGRCA